MLTVLFCIVVAAFICTVVAALGKCPLWIGVVLLCIAMLLQVMPLR